MADTFLTDPKKDAIYFSNVFDRTIGNLFTNGVFASILNKFDIDNTIGGLNFKVKTGGCIIAGHYVELQALSDSKSVPDATTRQVFISLIQSSGVTTGSQIEILNGTLPTTPYIQIANLTSSGGVITVVNQDMRVTPNTNFSDQPQYLPLSVTLGDYSLPASAVASSPSPSTESYDTAGTAVVITHTTTRTRVGEKVSSTAARNKSIISMTMSLKSAGATGTLNYVIRKVSDDSIVATSTTTLNAATIGAGQADYTLNFLGEILPNESFYALVEGIASGSIDVMGAATDTSANGIASYFDGSWNDLATSDMRMSIVYADFPAILSMNNNLANHWKSANEATPNIYWDFGSAREFVGLVVAINKTDTTITSIKFRASTDTTFTDAENIAYVSVLDFTDDTYRYMAINFLADNRRYIQAYSPETGVLSIAEMRARYGVADTVFKLTHKHKTRIVSSVDSFLDSN